MCKRSCEIFHIFMRFTSETALRVILPWYIKYFFILELCMHADFKKGHKFRPLYTQILILPTSWGIFTTPTYAFGFFVQQILSLLPTGVVERTNIVKMHIKSKQPHLRLILQASFSRMHNSSFELHHTHNNNIVPQPNSAYI